MWLVGLTPGCNIGLTLENQLMNPPVLTDKKRKYVIISAVEQILFIKLKGHSIKSHRK